MKFVAGLLIILLVAVIVGPQVFFVVDETELAIVTRFGEPLRSIKSAGIYVKTPFIDTVTKFEKRLLLFDAPPDSLLTADKKRLIIDVYARGRVVDPLQFFKTVGTETRAASRAIDIIASELRREIALDEQSEIIKTSREPIMNRVRDAVSPKLLEFGIEVVDVRIKRADFPEQIAGSVYDRMKAERQRIADRERAQGAEAKLKKEAEVDRTAIEIRSAARRDADITRGCGEAEAIDIFAEALEQDPEFYTFQRSLETYKAYLAQNTTLVGSALDFGQIFEDIRRGVTQAAKAPDEGVGSVATGPGLDELGSRCAEVAGRHFLATDLGIPATDLELMRVEQVDWEDSDLGCPEEGMVYTQAIVPGYRLDFQYQGSLYEVHTNRYGSQVLTCTPEQSAQAEEASETP